MLAAKGGPGLWGSIERAVPTREPSSVLIVPKSVAPIAPSAANAPPRSHHRLSRFRAEAASAMCRFVRFHTEIRDTEISHELGIFGALGVLEDRGRLSEGELVRVRATLDWFKDHLTVPRLDAECWRARFWFRDSAQPMVKRLWELVGILRERYIRVELITSVNPGLIVYRDQHQVAALPWPVTRRRH